MSGAGNFTPAPAQPEMMFYDGHCALCHGAVKFVLKHDRSGRAFRFAPLQGETFRALVPEKARQDLPDSIVVRTDGGAMLARSDAFIHILSRLGGGWKTFAAMTRAVPRPVRDFIYDLIARIRYRVFGTRNDLCPVVPAEWRSRIDP